jgi:hypothetical protein
MVWILLVGISLLHLYWGMGGLWPATNPVELSAIVIGDRPLPRPPACFAVAACVLFGPWLFPRLSALVFLLRGSLGMFEKHFRPSIRGTRYQRLSLWIYSPVSLLLGVWLWR